MSLSHPFQNNLKDELYINSRGAGIHASGVSKYIVDKIKEPSFTAIEKINILILGCFNGLNDVIPILDGIQNQNRKIMLWTIDDSQYGLENLRENLENRFYKIESDEKTILVLKKNEIYVNIVFGDIEEYPNVIFKNKFDIVVSFSVFNHLTNWQICIDKIFNILNDWGYLFVTEYHDPLITELESQVDKNQHNKNNPLGLIFNFHEKRKVYLGVKYIASVYGSQIDNFRNYLMNMAVIKNIYSLGYSREIDKKNIILRITNSYLHSPVFWGIEYKVKVSQGEQLNFERESDEYYNFMREFQNEIDASGKDYNYKYEGNLVLFEFQKLLFPYSKKIDLYDAFLGKINREFEFIMGTELSEQKFNEKLLQQILIAYQAFIRGTHFFSLILWNLRFYKESLIIDFSKPSTSFLTLFNSRDNYEYLSFEKYFLHLALYRSHDMQIDLNEEKYSLAEIVFKYSKCDMDWVILKSETEFNCKFIQNSLQNFIVIYLPQKYLFPNPQVGIDFNLGLFLGTKFINFSSIDLSEILLKLNVESHNKIKEIDMRLFNKAIIEKEEDTRIGILKSEFEKFDSECIIWTPKERNLLISNIAKRIPFFTYLVQLGPIIYLTNKLNNKPFLNSGGFFFSEAVEIDELSSKYSFLSQRYKFLKDILNLYSQKVILPFIGKMLINSERKLMLESLKSAISAIMSRNMSHNIGSHVIADMVSKGINVGEGELNSFFRYLQNRMDFIAQISTDFPEWTYPTYFNKELMKTFYDSYILIDRIGVSEGLSAYDWPNDNNWRQGDMRGKIIVRTCTTEWEKGVEIKDKLNWGVNEYHMETLVNDLQLAIPGGIVGYHALYIIIENIIRNSAKHDYASRMKDRLNLNNGMNDELILIKRKNCKECSFWVVFKDNKNDIINDKNEIEKRIKSCRGLIIESPCLKVEKEQNSNEYDFISLKGEDNLEIKLIDDKVSSLIIPRDDRFFIACIVNSHKDNCQFNIKKEKAETCLVVDKKYWQESKLYYQVLTEKEYDQLKNEYDLIKNDKESPNAGATDDRVEQPFWKKRYDKIINFLQRGPLRINIRIDDIVDKDYVWVTIWDNMRHKPSSEFDKNNDSNNEVSGNISEDDIKKRVLKIPANVRDDEYKLVNLFGYMNDRLRQAFIKEDGELKRENWGLAELKICAGFLQNRKIDEIGGSGQDIIQYGEDFNIKPEFIINETDNPNQGYPRMLIKALPVDKKGQLFDIKRGGKLGKEDFYFLGFRFWMKKPKSVALVGTDYQLKDDRNGS